MIIKEQAEAMKIWFNEIGDKEYSYDFTGKKIKRSDYLEKNQVGWVIAFIKPLELGGSNNVGNTMIMHHRTFELKGMQYPHVMIEEQEFVIHYVKKDDYYYIEKVLSADEDDDGIFI